MTSLLVRGKVHTFDDKGFIASNLLLRDGVVCEIDSGVVDADDVVELGPDEYLQPGWRDDHLHLLSTLAVHCSQDLSEARTIGDLLQLVDAASPGDNGWIRAWGYEPSLLTERRHPTQTELDEVTGKCPIVVHDRTGHVAVINTAAAAILNADHYLEGLLVEREDILRQVPSIGISDLKRIAQTVFDEWRDLGLVALTDATHTNDIDSVKLLAEIKKECNGPQMTAMIGADRLDGLRFGDTYGDVEIGHAKVMPDVELQQNSKQLVRAAHEAGFPVAIHVMDIDTLEEALQALEASPCPGPVSDRLEHCSLALPEQLDRVALTGATVCTQPSFLTRRLNKYVENLSSVEQTWLWPLSSLIERNIAVTLSSDSPVVPVNPDEWINAATSRPISCQEVVTERQAKTMTVVSPVAAGMSADLLVRVTPTGYKPLAGVN